jgi:hypothetical protein
VKDIAGLTVTQYRIFAADVVPMSQLITPVITEALKTRFSFKTAVLDPDSGDLVLQAGTLVLDGNETLAHILVLRFGVRRIVVQVLGTSALANLVFAGVEEAVQVFTDARLAEPIAFVEETVCAVTLDLDWQELLAPDLRKFVSHSVLPAASSDDAEAFLKHVSLRFQIGYRRSERYRANGVSAADKLFTVEPRVDMPLGENRYFASSPVGSEEHLRLLREFEESVGKRKKKPPVKT